MFLLLIYLSTYRPDYFSTSTYLPIFLPLPTCLFFYQPFLIYFLISVPAYLAIYLYFLLTFLIPSFFPSYLSSFLPTSYLLARPSPLPSLAPNSGRDNNHAHHGLSYIPRVPYRPEIPCRHKSIASFVLSIWRLSRSPKNTKEKIIICKLFPLACLQYLELYVFDFSILFIIIIIDIDYDDFANKAKSS